VELREALAGVVPMQTEDDGALTVRHDGTVASLRVEAGQSVGAGDLVATIA